MPSEEIKEQLNRHRKQFPALANKFYFNYGAQGPMPQSAIEAIHQSYEYVQHWGPFSAETVLWVMQELEQVRTAIAYELGVPSETITLTENVSTGCNIVLWGMDWQPGDHLLLSDCETPGVVAAVQEIQQRFDVEVSTCPLSMTLNDGDPTAMLVNHLRPNTRLAVLSHVFWNTGQVLPVAEIMKLCRNHSTWKHPVRILVDAAQSVGVLPLNLTELDVDFYAFTGSKWWCGPEGVGGLYVKPEALDDVRPTFIGWRSVATAKSNQKMGWHSDGRRFEIATSAYPLYVGLRTALAVHQRGGSPVVRYEQIRGSSKYLWERLRELQYHMFPTTIACLNNSPPEGGIVCLQLRGESQQELVQFLETQGSMTRMMHNPECVRVCTHYFTHLSEIDSLIEQIQKFCRRKVAG